MKKLREGEKFQILMDELKTVKNLDELIECWLISKGGPKKNSDTYVHEISQLNLLDLQKKIFDFYGIC